MERTGANPSCQERPNGGRSGDYITVRKAGNQAVPSLARAVCQAWLKLTTHRAFVTITCGLET